MSDAFDWSRVHWRPRALPVLHERCSYCGQRLTDAEHVTSRHEAPDGSARMAVFCARCLGAYWDDLVGPR
jgi:uncharacterized protein with PIN domain